LGVVIYYASGIVFVFVLVILDELFGYGIDWDNAKGLELMAIPIGIAADYGFQYILKKKWEKSIVLVADEIEDIGKHENDTDIS